MTVVQSILFVLLLGLQLTFLHSAVDVHVHNETPERDSASFYYDADTHYLVMAIKTTCFMTPLSTEEKDQVHTSHGIAELELKMLREWIGKLPEVRIYHDGAHLPRHIGTICHNRDIFLLERQGITGMTTPGDLTTSQAIG